MYRKYAVTVALAVVVTVGIAADAEARDWTCHATLALQGSTFSYAVPSWGMSGPVTMDREKQCRLRVKKDWLDNGAIWSKLGIAASQQGAFCQSGGNFRVDYGFDQRRKDWNFTDSSKPNCACTGPFTFK